MENGKLAQSSELKHNEKSIKVLLKAENCMIDMRILSQIFSKGPGFELNVYAD